MELRELIFGLNECAGIGWHTIDNICRKGILSEKLFSAGKAEWELVGLGGKVSGRLAAEFDAKWVSRRRRMLEEKGIGMLTRLDPGYPPRLKLIPQPPWVLYYKGKLELASAPSVAMVGTRVPTAYGRKVAAEFGQELAGSGLAVVSGLARGIDAVSHEAALGAGGRTVAVMATGMDRIYPSEHLALARAIAGSGLLLTEYPLGTPSHPGLFPRRNRIIAGLALGTLVVEADSRSGSLITADFALESGRDVFAVPGPITSPKSRGTLELIKQGAKLVTGAQDVLEEYGSELSQEHGLFSSSENGTPLGRDAAAEKRLTTEELRLYDILQQGPLTVDGLLAASGWHFGHLHSVLLSLIIKKAVTQLPGAIYKVI